MEVYLLILILVIGFSFFYSKQKTTKLRAMQTQGLINVSLIKQLISAVQQHRGLSSAWLNGDSTKKAALTVKEKEIADVCLSIKQTGLPNFSARWQSFTDHWSRLMRTDSNRDVDNNFKQHTQMIANLLYLLEDEAERNSLHSDALPKLPQIGYVWRELVLTTEIVGQSRAIGTGVATSKMCSSVDKIRLSFLEQHIKDTGKILFTDLPKLDRFSARHDSLLNHAQDYIEELIRTIEVDLVQTDRVSIDHNLYFKLASDTISALDKIFEHQIEQVKVSL